MGYVVSICKLCGKGEKLCKSHIISEFFYEPLYDEKKHQIHILSSRSEKHPRFVQKGAYESLLCTQCEGVLSVWEKYASNIFKREKSLSFEKREGYLKIGSLNYEYFKLFELSVLWRASISSHSLFRNVDLGSHENKIRKALLNRKALKSAEYGCLKFALFKDGDFFDHFVDQADNGKIDSGHRFVRMVFGGFMWIFFVTSHRLPENISRHFLAESGEMNILFKDFFDLKYLVPFSHKLQEMGRLQNI